MNESERYGYCPKCGAPGEQRERRMNGNDICQNGHTYPSHTALRDKPTVDNNERV